MNNFNKVKKVLGRWFSWPWYPLAFGAYPVLALLAQNVGEVKLEAGWRPLLVSVGLAVILGYGDSSFVTVSAPRFSPPYGWHLFFPMGMCIY
jgi:hypothetical protein